MGCASVCVCWWLRPSSTMVAVRVLCPALLQSLPLLTSVGAPGDLLSAAAILIPADTAWLGAQRTTNDAWAYTFVDGTPNTSLTCGSRGCGPWGSRQPDNAGGGEDKLCIYRNVVNDCPSTSSLWSLCEYEWISPAGFTTTDSITMVRRPAVRVCGPWAGFVCECIRIRPPIRQPCWHDHTSGALLCCC
jgi:hypothetical protein